MTLIARCRWFLVALLSFASGLASSAPLQVQRVDDDKFSKDIAIIGAELNEHPFLGAMRRWAIRSWVNKKTGAPTHQLYVVIDDPKGYASYGLAADDNAQDLEVTRVGLLSAESETVGIALDDDVLRARASTGYAIKLSAKSGASVILSITPEQIEVQLAEVERQRATVATTPAQLERRRLAQQAEIERRVERQQREAQEAEVRRPMLAMVPSFTPHAASAFWVKSSESPVDPIHPSASILGVACKDGRKPLVAVGTDFLIKKTWSIAPPMTDVRFYFDADSSHYNWEQFGPSEAGPMGGIGGFVNSMATAKVLKVAFEREGKPDREVVTFALDDPELRARLVSFLKACQ